LREELQVAKGHEAEGTGQESNDEGAEGDFD